MDTRIVDSMRRKGELVKLPDGTEGVPVALHYRGHLVRPSTESLRMVFHDADDLLIESGARMDWSSMSPAGQVVEAIIPIQTLDQLESTLRESAIEVVPVEQLEIV